jgi:hypothetical protein
VSKNNVEAFFTLRTKSDAREVLGDSKRSAKEYEGAIGELRTEHKRLQMAERSLVGSSSEVKQARKSLRDEHKKLESSIGELALANLKLAKSEETARESALARRESMKSGSLLGRAAKAFDESALKKGAEKALKSVSESIGKARDKVATKVDNLKKAAADTKVGKLAAKVGGEFRAISAIIADSKIGQAAKKGFAALTEVAGPALSSTLGAIGPLCATGAGALLVLGAAAITAGAGFIGFTIKLADSERSLRLTRTALLGSAAAAESLNLWERKLADSTGLSRAEVSQYSDAFGRARLSNKEYSASLEATTMAQVAMGSQLSGKIQELTTRHAKMGVFTLGRFELDGTGLQVADVAKALAQNTHVSLQEARAAMESGRLPLQRGAEAIRDAVRTKFGNIVEAKSISLDSLGKRAQDRLSGFFQAINIDPLLKAAENLLKEFDANTVTGKQFVKVLDSAVSAVTWLAGKAVPDAIEKFRGAAIVSAVIYGTWLDLKIQIAQARLALVGFEKTAGSVVDKLAGAKRLFGMTRAADKGIRTEGQAPAAPPAQRPAGATSSGIEAQLPPVAGASDRLAASGALTIKAAPVPPAQIFNVSVPMKILGALEELKGAPGRALMQRLMREALGGVVG